MKSGTASSGNTSRLPNIAEWIAWTGLLPSTIPPSAAASRTTKIGAPMRSSTAGTATTSKAVIAHPRCRRGSSIGESTQKEPQGHQHRHQPQADGDEGLRNPHRRLQCVAALVERCEQRYEMDARDRDGCQHHDAGDNGKHLRRTLDDARRPLDDG